MDAIPFMIGFVHRCGLSRLFLLLFVLFYSVNCAAENSSDYNLAFYYGNKPPLNKLKFYKNIVVEPSSGINPRTVETATRKIFAYASLGEAISLNQYAKPIDKSWVMGKNDRWQSLVLDQSNPAWQAFFLNSVITPLWDRGYRGFFLDTLDSYRLASQDPKQMKKQQDGIVFTIRAIKKKYPDVKLILNRGFEILPQIKSSVDEVVAESLFNGWNNKTKQYFIISEQDRKNLLKELIMVKQMGIPVTVVDYIAPNDQEKAKTIAKQITALGFNPWVTNGDLTKLYLFDFDLIPRKILLFYQGKLNKIDEKTGSYMSKAVSMPLNNLGYVTVLRNIAEPLPHDLSAKDYAGIIVAIDGYLMGREEDVYNWYQEQIQKKIPLILLDQFGFSLDNNKLNPLGLSTPSFAYYPRSLQVVFQSPLIDYEISPTFKPEYFTPITLLKGTSLLKVRDEIGTVSDVAAITPWGGYFLTNNFLIPITDNNYRWVINPFEFFKQALRLPSLPIPDTTTENGRRLMFVHIDGDGFANKGEWHKGPFVGEIMRKEFLEHYAIPSTVSIIQGEIAPNGIHPDLSTTLEKIARQIFALPYVEIASHTYSHPFNWQDAAGYKGTHSNPFTLKIPNYHFNLYAEVNGSVEYINKNLAPPGKQCKVFLWSGEGDVPEKALELAYQLGLANLNPGTIITKYNNSMTRVSSLGLFEGPYFQVFAPIGNDNEAQGQIRIFYSLITIIDALKLTDKPHRLKPIDIYTHFYSVAQPGGVNALHAVYDWALAQPVMNIYASDYFNKTMDFNELMIAKKKDGWLFETNDSLRELRIPRSMGYPDLIHSTNVIGYSFYNDDCYIHLGPGGEAFVRLTKQPAMVPFLIDSNARVTRFVRNNKGCDFSLEGYLPPKFTFANMGSCTLWHEGKKMSHQQQQRNQKSYEFKKGTNYEFSIRCE